MSTVNNITSSVISAFQGVAPVNEVAPVEAPANNAPSFQETLTTQGRAFALGLGAPRNHGDIEALFAEIATKFGAEVSKANDYAAAAQTALRSTALGAAAGSLAFFATFNTIMISAEFNIKNQNQIINLKNQEIMSLEAEKAPLVAQRDQLQAELSRNNATITSNNLTLAGLYVQLGPLELSRATACGIDAGGTACQDLTAATNQLKAQIDGLNAQNASLSSRNTELNGQISTLTTQINALQAQIDAAKGVVNAATSSRNQSQQDYNLALATLNLFAAVLIPFAVALALGQIAEGARASFKMGPDQKGFDDAIAQAVNRLAELSSDMGTLNMIRQALAQSLPSSPDSISGVERATTNGVDGASELQSVDGKPTTETVPVPKDDLQGPPVLNGVDSSQEPPATPAFEEAAPPTLGDLGERQSAMDMLRQLLTNLPLPTEGLLPDPVPDGQQAIPQEPQGALDLLREVLADMLPPGAGDAEVVANRAGEIAAALALIRGVLGQVAQSESAQMPQVPSASGRFNLVI